MKAEWHEGDWESKILSIPDLPAKLKRELILEIENKIEEAYQDGKNRAYEEMDEF